MARQSWQHTMQACVDVSSSAALVLFLAEILAGEVFSTWWDLHWAYQCFFSARTGLILTFD